MSKHDCIYSYLHKINYMKFNVQIWKFTELAIQAHNYPLKVLGNCMCDCTAGVLYEEGFKEGYKVVTQWVHAFIFGKRAQWVAQEGHRPKHCRLISKNLVAIATIGQRDVICPYKVPILKLYTKWAMTHIM